ncbi:hypothetical protein NIES267_36150 [Calothrix parasitica NIES-267]|uniref:Uncharacterized protein n=1 Tax=Calothrix parasitica NIES-267 TaxID=1973488 RepID=A0A1Z4LSA2_9CYAN|nr:hypothetical protein NIES267_36150 [Calothrix parasitica NIES-267]
MSSGQVKYRQLTDNFKSLTVSKIIHIYLLKRLLRLAATALRLRLSCGVSKCR